MPALLVRINQSLVMAKRGRANDNVVDQISITTSKPENAVAYACAHRSNGRECALFTRASPIEPLGPGTKEELVKNILWSCSLLENVVAQ
ncbi:hypothetical protein RB195_010336 [Necator americanus]|uniref:Uncharacterized protein n=1 Tax=Necator americanus TaxID=51031 RepID=A0ABR1CZA8_NECAM